MGELSRWLPIGYLLMVLVGMLFNYFKFDYFGVNIFQYASVFDFLISPFEDTHILIFIFASMLVVVFSIVMDRLWEKHFPKSYRRWSFCWTQKKWYKPFSYTLVVVVYLFYGAYIYGNYTYNSVLGQDDIRVRYTDNETLQGKLVGKVGDTLFLWCGADVKAIPLNAYVKEVSIPQEPSGESDE